jgi:hypothetical protein
MMITSQAQALELLDDEREVVTTREAAIRYLAKEPTSEVIAHLVQALQDDDFSIRWEAANAIAQQGEAGMLAVLQVLTDAKRVGDPRLRECAYHILHLNADLIPVPIIELLEALHGGPAADIASLIEADRVLRRWKKYRSAQALTTIKPEATRAVPLTLLNPREVLAQLTGRLSRLARRC